MVSFVLYLSRSSPEEGSEIFLADLEGCSLGEMAETSDCCKKRPDEVTQNKNVENTGIAA